MRFEELTQYSRILDRQRHKEYLLLAVERHPSVLLLTLKDAKTGEISERQPVTLKNLEQRFTLVETGPFDEEDNGPDMPAAPDIAPAAFVVRESETHYSRAINRPSDSASRLKAKVCRRQMKPATMQARFSVLALSGWGLIPR